MTDPHLEERRYLEAARRAGLSADTARQSWRLFQDTPYPAAPKQPEANLVVAYQDAHRHSAEFHRALQAFGAANAVDIRTRPGFVKDANRSIEKMARRPTVIPADLLGGTVVAVTVRQMYTLAERLRAFFTVVSFRDRMLDRLPSGYGDLQCLVDLGGHLAELKVVHQLFHDVDRHEHRVYEIVRSLEAAHPDELPRAERFVVEALIEASRQMYTRAWKAILTDEGGER